MVRATMTPSSAPGGESTSLETRARQSSAPDCASSAITSPSLVPTMTSPSPTPGPPAMGTSRSVSHTAEPFAAS